MPWKRAAMLVHKKPYSAIFSMAQHTNRIPLFNWLGPLTTARTYFYKLKSRPDVTVNTLNDTTLYSLGMVRGDIYQSLVKKIGFVNGAYSGDGEHRFRFYREHLNSTHWVHDIFNLSVHDGQF